MGRTSDCSKMSRRTVQYWIAECRYSLIRYEGRGKGRIVQNFILVSQNWAFLLHPAVRCAILIIEKGKTTAHKGLASQRVNRITTLRLGQSFGVVFLCLKHYLSPINSPLNNFQCLRSPFHRGFFSLDAVLLLSIEPCRQFCPLFLRQSSFLWPDRDKPFRERVPLRHNLTLIGFYLSRLELFRVLLHQLIHFPNPYRVSRVNLCCSLCRIKTYGYFLLILLVTSCSYFDWWYFPMLKSPFPLGSCSRAYRVYKFFLYAFSPRVSCP